MPAGARASAPLRDTVPVAAVTTQRQGALGALSAAFGALTGSQKLLRGQGRQHRDGAGNSASGNAASHRRYDGGSPARGRVAGAGFTALTQPLQHADHTHSTRQKHRRSRNSDAGGGAAAAVPVAGGGAAVAAAGVYASGTETGLAEAADGRRAGAVDVPMTSTATSRVARASKYAVAADEAGGVDADSEAARLAREATAVARDIRRNIALIRRHMRDRNGDAAAAASESASGQSRRATEVAARQLRDVCWMDVSLVDAVVASGAVAALTSLLPPARAAVARPEVNTNSGEGDRHYIDGDGDGRREGGDYRLDRHGNQSAGTGEGGGVAVPRGTAHNHDGIGTAPGLVVAAPLAHVRAVKVDGSASDSRTLAPASDPLGVPVGPGRSALGTLKARGKKRATTTILNGTRGRSATIARTTVTVTSAAATAAAAGAAAAVVAAAAPIRVPRTATVVMSARGNLRGNACFRKHFNLRVDSSPGSPSSTPTSTNGSVSRSLPSTSSVVQSIQLARSVVAAMTAAHGATGPLASPAAAAVAPAAPTLSSLAAVNPQLKAKSLRRIKLAKAGRTRFLDPTLTHAHAAAALCGIARLGGERAVTVVAAGALPRLVVLLERVTSLLLGVTARTRAEEAARASGAAGDSAGGSGGSGAASAAAGAVSGPTGGGAAAPSSGMTLASAVEMGRRMRQRARATSRQLELWRDLQWHTVAALDFCAQAVCVAQAGALSLRPHADVAAEVSATAAGGDGDASTGGVGDGLTAAFGAAPGCVVAVLLIPPEDMGHFVVWDPTAATSALTGASDSDGHNDASYHAPAAAPRVQESESRSASSRTGTGTGGSHSDHGVHTVTGVTAADVADMPKLRTHAACALTHMARCGGALADAVCDAQGLAAMVAVIRRAAGDEQRKESARRRASDHVAGAGARHSSASQRSQTIPEGAAVVVGAASGGGDAPGSSSGARRDGDHSLARSQNARESRMRIVIATLVGLQAVAKGSPSRAQRAVDAGAAAALVALLLELIPQAMLRGDGGQSSTSSGRGARKSSSSASSSSRLGRSRSRGAKVSEALVEAVHALGVLVQGGAGRAQVLFDAGVLKPLVALIHLDVPLVRPRWSVASSSSSTGEGDGSPGGGGGGRLAAAAGADDFTSTSAREVAASVLRMLVATGPAQVAHIASAPMVMMAVVSLLQLPSAIRGSSTRRSSGAGDRDGSGAPRPRRSQLQSHGDRRLPRASKAASPAAQHEGIDIVRHMLFQGATTKRGRSRSRTRSRGSADNGHTSGGGGVADGTAVVAAAIVHANGVEALAAIARAGRRVGVSAWAREHACKALDDLARCDASTAMQLVSRGAADALAVVMATPDGDSASISDAARDAAAAAIAGIVATAGDAAAAALIERRVLLQLLVATSVNTAGRAHSAAPAVNALRLLAANAAVAEHLANSGAVEALTSLLRSAPTRVRAEAAAALHSICSNGPSFARALLSADAHLALIAALTVDTVAATSTSTEAGTAESLAQGHSTTGGSDVDDLVAHAAAALAGMARLGAKIAKQLVAAGAVDALTVLLATPQSASVQEQARCALLNIGAME